MLGANALPLSQRVGDPYFTGNVRVHLGAFNAAYRNILHFPVDSRRVRNTADARSLAAIRDASISGRRLARELSDLIVGRGKPDMIVPDHGRNSPRM